MILIGEKIDTDQWNKIEGPEIVSHKYGQLYFYKNEKQFSGKRWSFLQMVLDNLMSICKK